MNVIVGFHSIEESIRAKARGELYISAQSPRAKRLADSARRAHIQVRFADDRELSRIARGAEHRGAVFVSAESDGPVLKDLDSAISSIKSVFPLVVVLDQVTDPHNLGAVLRSADLFNVDFVVIPSRRTAHAGQTVVKTSAGASNYVTLCAVPNLVRALTSLKNADFWIYGAAMDGGAVDRCDLTGPVALVLGSEGEGLKRLVRESCDGLISIPTGGHIDSLNVSVAAGICMYEIRRQQRGATASR